MGGYDGDFDAERRNRPELMNTGAINTGAKHPGLMRAATMRDWALEITEVPIPAPRPHQILTRMRACGICGSDLHMLRHGAEMRAEQARLATEDARWTSPTSEATISTAFDPAHPTVMGHEFCCEVVDLGSQAAEINSDLAIGDLVVSYPVALDHPLDLRTLHTVGYSNTYPGGYGQYLVLDAARTIKVPDATPANLAALTEPLAVGIHAVAKSGIAPGEGAVVLGLGPVGLACVATLRAQGIGPIIGADFSPARRALGELFGCDAVVDPNHTPAMHSWNELGGGRPVVIFEAVGVPGLIDQAMRMAPRQARILVVGVCMQTDHIHPMVGIGKELTVQFALGYSAAEFALALTWISDQVVDLAPMITDTVTIDQIPQAFEALSDPEQQAKILVVSE
jgi:threonine dehydrogenase-like Zn-dependent dehydrogenase